MTKSKYMLTDELVEVEPELTPSEISLLYKGKNIEKQKKFILQMK